MPDYVAEARERLAQAERLGVKRSQRCVKAPDVPHGEGHNKVCVCQCPWCILERAEVDLRPSQLGLFGGLG